MDRDTFEQGLTIRKEVLSAEHVERSLAGADDFSLPYQELVTEYCWGAVWGRPGLSRKTRSLLNLAMLTALNREEEFKLHVRAAFRNGVTQEEIREVLLQAMIYCGVPAANSAFKQAREVFAQMESAKGAACADPPNGGATMTLRKCRAANARRTDSSREERTMKITAT